MTLTPSSASNATSANQQGQKREDHDLLSLRFKVNRFGDEKTIQKSVSARTTIAQLRDDFLFDQGKDGTSAQEAIETVRSTMKIRFFHAGKYLAEDGCSLEQYSIRDDTCLHVFITKNLAATAASSSESAAGETAQPAGARTIQVGGQVFQISGDENPAEDPGSRHWFLEGILPVLQRSASGNLFGGTSSSSAEAGAGPSVEGPPEGAGRASSSTTRPQTANNSARDGDGTRQADGDDGDIEQGRRPPGRGGRPSDHGTTAGEQGPPQPLTDAQRAHLEMQQRILNFFGVATTPLLPGRGGGTTTGAGGATSSTAAAPTVAGRPHLLRTPDQELISTSAAVVPAGARGRLGAGEGGAGVPRPQAMTWRHFAQQLSTNGDAPNGEIPEECRLGYHRDMVLIWPTLPGVMCGLCFYPYGMCCCLLHKIRRCPHCGYTVHSC